MDFGHRLGRCWRPKAFLHLIESLSRQIAQTSSKCVHHAKAACVRNWAPKPSSCSVQFRPFVESPKGSENCRGNKLQETNQRGNSNLLNAHVLSVPTKEAAGGEARAHKSKIVHARFFSSLSCICSPPAAWQQLAHTGRGWPMLFECWAQVRAMREEKESIMVVGQAGRRQAPLSPAGLLCLHGAGALPQRSPPPRHQCVCGLRRGGNRIHQCPVCAMRSAFWVHTGGHGGQRRGAGGARPLVRLPRPAAAQQAQEDRQELRSGGAEFNQQPATGSPRHGAHRAGVSGGRRDHRVRRPPQRHPHQM